MGSLRHPQPPVNVQSFRHSRDGVSDFRQNARSVDLRMPRVASSDTKKPRLFARHPDTDAALTPPRRSPTLGLPDSDARFGRRRRSCEGRVFGRRAGP
jgi:hypothetical protein